MLVRFTRDTRAGWTWRSRGSSSEDTAGGTGTETGPGEEYTQAPVASSQPDLSSIQGQKSAQLEEASGSNASEADTRDAEEASVMRVASPTASPTRHRRWKPVLLLVGALNAFKTSRPSSGAETPEASTADVLEATGGLSDPEVLSPDRHERCPGGAGQHAEPEAKTRQECTSMATNEIHLEILEQALQEAQSGEHNVVVSALRALMDQLEELRQRAGQGQVEEEAYARFMATLESSRLPAAVTALILQQSMKPVAQHAAMRSITVTCSHSPLLRKEFMARGTVKAIMGVMERFHQNERLLSACSVAVASARGLVTPECCVEVPETLFEVGRRFTGDRHVQVLVCTTLITLANDAHFCYTVGDAEAHTLVTVMRAHARDAAVQSSCCRLISALGRGHAGVAAILGRAGACTCLTEACRHFAAQPKLQATAWEALVRLCVADSRGCGYEVVATQCFVRLLQTVMATQSLASNQTLESHGTTTPGVQPRNVLVQALAIAAKLCDAGQGLSYVLIREVAQMLAAVVQDPLLTTAADIFTRACDVCESLLDMSSDAATLLAEAGFTAPVGRLWRMHIKDTSGHSSVLACLHAVVVTDPQEAEVFRSNGGVEALMTCLRKHAADQRVGNLGWPLLTWLCRHSRHSLAATTSLGAAEVAAAALATWEGCAEVQPHVLDAALVLCMGEENKGRLGAGGACKWIVQALAAGVAPVLSLHVTAALAVGNVSNATAFVEHGVHAAMAGALQQHQESGMVLPAVAEVVLALQGTGQHAAELYVRHRIGSHLVMGLASSRLEEGELVTVTKAVSSIAELDICSREDLGSHGACEVVVACLKQHVLVNDLSAALCACVRALAHECPRNRLKLGAAGACEALASASKTLVSDTVRSRALLCSAAASLAVDCRENGQRLRQAGMCDAIAKLVDRCTDCIAVTRAATYATAALIACDPGHEELFGGPAHIADLLMEQLRASLSLRVAQDLESALEAVAMVCRGNPAVRAKLATSDSVRSLAKAMHAAGVQPRAQAKACKALEELVQGSPGTVRSLVTCEGVEAVISALESLATSSEDCKPPLRLLRCTADASPDVVSRLCTLRFCGTVVTLLKLHHRDAEVAELIRSCTRTLVRHSTVMSRLMGDAGLCEALEPLLMVNPPCGISLDLVHALATGCKNNTSRLGENGACGFLVRLWKTRRATEELSTEVYLLELVRVMADGSTENIERLAQEGACELLLSAIKACPAERRVVLSGFSAVAAILQGAVGAVVSKLTLNALLPPIMHSLKSFSGDVEVQAAACEVLALLAEACRPNRVALAKEDWCELVVKMMSATPSTIAVQSAGLKLIAGLSLECADNARRLRAAQALATMLDAMTRPGLRKHAGIQRAGLSAIGCLAAADFDTGAALGTMGACVVVVTALKSMSNDVTVLRRGLEAVAALASCSAENRARLSDAGVCEVVAAALQALPHHAGLLIWACGCIVRLCEGSVPNIKRFLHCGVPERIAAAIEQIPAAVEQCLDSVTCMARDEEWCAVLATSGVCEVVVKALQNTKSVSIHVACCRATRAFAAGGAAYVERLIKAGAATTLNSLVKRSPGDANIQAAGWEAQTALIRGNPSVGKDLGRDGACEQVLKLFSDFASSRRMIRIACEAAAELARASHENNERLSASGLCEAAVQALSMHIADCHVCAMACSVISALACGASTNQSRLAAVGACEAIVKACLRYPADQTVQIYAVRAMTAFASGQLLGGMKVALGDAGAVGALVIALKVPHNDRDLTAALLHALMLLTEGHDANRRTLVEVGAAATIAECLRAHKNDSEVVARLCTVVEALCASGTSDTLSLQNSMLAVDLLVALKASASDVGLQVAACRALYALSPHSKRAGKEISDFGMCPILARLLSSAADDKASLMAAAHLVDMLAQDPSNAEILGKEGACEAAVRAMRRHRNEVGVQAVCCHVVWRLLVGDPANVIKLAAAGAADALLHALNALADCSEAQPAVYYALAVLAASTKVRYDQGSDMKRWCQVIVQGLTRFANQPTFQAEGCYAASTLAKAHKSAKVVLGANGTCELVAAAVARFVKDANVQVEAWGAIGYLAADNTENQRRFGQSGLLTQLVPILEAHAKVEQVLITALDAARTLAGHRENKSVLEETGLRAWLHSASSQPQGKQSAQLCAAFSECVRAMSTVERKKRKVCIKQIEHSQDDSRSAQCTMTESAAKPAVAF